MTGAQYRKISLILTNIKNGNREAFTEIYEEYEKKIYFLCSKLLNNRTDAKKMTIDLFDYIYLNCSGFTKADVFEKWLYNHLFTKCRRFIIDNCPERFGDYIDTNSPDGEQIDVLMAEDADAMMANENGIDISVDMMQTMDSIISDMPLKQCTAVLMYYFCGFDIEESASALQISQPAVKNRLYKAHIALETAEHKYSEMGYDVNGIVVFLPDVLSVMADSIVVPEDIAAGVTSSTGVNCMKNKTAAANPVGNNDNIDPYATMIIQTPSSKKSSNYTTTNYATPVTPKRSTGQDISPAVKVIMAIVALLIIIGGTVAVVLAVQGRSNPGKENGSVSGIENTEVPKTVVISTTETTTERETTTEPTTVTTTEATTEAPTTAVPTTEAPVVHTEPQTTAPAEPDPEPIGGDTPVDMGN